jgi:hypothetical protein
MAQMEAATASALEFEACIRQPEDLATLYPKLTLGLEPPERGLAQLRLRIKISGTGGAVVKVCAAAIVAAAVGEGRVPDRGVEGDRRPSRQRGLVTVRHPLLCQHVGAALSLSLADGVHIEAHPPERRLRPPGQMVRPCAASLRARLSARSLHPGADRTAAAALRRLGAMAGWQHGQGQVLR